MDVQLIGDTIWSMLILGIIGIIPLALLIVGIILLVKKKVHKVISIFLIVLGGVVLACNLFYVIIILIMLYDSNTGISIIGGADGPTSVFVAGRVNSWDYGMMIVGILLFLISIYIIIKKKIPFLKSFNELINKTKYSITIGYGILAVSIFSIVGGLLDLNVSVLVLICIVIGMITLLVARK